MKNDQYLKHDASASGNQKLMNLIQKEGMRGYGTYWFLLETLRCQPRMRAPLSVLGAIARRARSSPKYLLKIVQCYDLFVVADGMFHSEGMDKRMKPFVMKQNDPSTILGSVKIEDNQLIINESVGDSARIAEKRREEKSNNNRKAEAVADDEKRSSLALRSWESLVDEMAADRSWMDMVGTHSGLGQLYLDHRAEVVDLFRQHIRLYDKGGGLLRINDVRQYFANYLAAGGRTCQGVRQRLLDMLRQRQTDVGVSPHETIVDGRRTYLGRPIPDDAPPRPDEYAVWNEETHRWER